MDGGDSSDDELFAAIANAGTVGGPGRLGPRQLISPPALWESSSDEEMAQVVYDDSDRRKDASSSEKRWIGDEPQGGRVRARARPRMIGGGKYVSGAKLGAGTSATVVEALNSQTLRVTAAKIIDTKKLRRIKGGPENLKREIEVHRSLKKHPNLIELLEVYHDEPKNRTYLFLEMANGCAVDELLERSVDATLAPEQVAHYAYQVLKAVTYMHGRGCVHRDIKPGNMLLTADGVLKLADFGVSESLSLYTAEDSVTRTSGSPAFQAPEIARGDAEYSGMGVDVWALGVSCYQMLTGEVPFQAASLAELFKKISAGEFVPLDSNMFDKQTRDCVERMLVPDWRERASTEELLEMFWISSAAERPSKAEREKQGWTEIPRKKFTVFELAQQLVEEGKVPDTPLALGRTGQAPVRPPVSSMSSMFAPPSPSKDVSSKRTSKPSALKLPSNSNMSSGAESVPSRRTSSNNLGLLLSSSSVPPTPTNLAAVPSAGLEGWAKKERISAAARDCTPPLAESSLPKVLCSSESGGDIQPSSPAAAGSESPTRRQDFTELVGSDAGVTESIDRDGISFSQPHSEDASLDEAALARPGISLISNDRVTEVSGPVASGSRSVSESSKSGIGSENVQDFCTELSSAPLSQKSGDGAESVDSEKAAGEAEGRPTNTNAGMKVDGAPSNLKIRALTVLKAKTEANTSLHCQHQDNIASIEGITNLESTRVLDVVPSGNELLPRMVALSAAPTTAIGLRRKVTTVEPAADFLPDGLSLPRGELADKVDEDDANRNVVIETSEGRASPLGERKDILPEGQKVPSRVPGPVTEGVPSVLETDSQTQSGLVQNLAIETSDGRASPSSDCGNVLAGGLDSATGKTPPVQVAGYGLFAWVKAVLSAVVGLMRTLTGTAAEPEENLLAATLSLPRGKLDEKYEDAPIQNLAREVEDGRASPSAECDDVKSGEQQAPNRALSSEHNGPPTFATEVAPPVQEGEFGLAAGEQAALSAALGLGRKPQVTAAEPEVDLLAVALSLPRGEPVEQCENEPIQNVAIEASDGRPSPSGDYGDVLAGGRQAHNLVLGSATVDALPVQVADSGLDAGEQAAFSAPFDLPKVTTEKEVVSAALSLPQGKLAEEGDNEPVQDLTPDTSDGSASHLGDCGDDLAEKQVSHGSALGRVAENTPSVQEGDFELAAGEQAALSAALGLGREPQVTAAEPEVDLLAAALSLPRGEPVEQCENEPIQNVAIEASDGRTSPSGDYGDVLAGGRQAHNLVLGSATVDALPVQVADSGLDAGEQAAFSATFDLPKVTTEKEVVSAALSLPRGKLAEEGDNEPVQDLTPDTSDGSASHLGDCGDDLAEKQVSHGSALGRVAENTPSVQEGDFELAAGDQAALSAALGLGRKPQATAAEPEVDLLAAALSLPRGEPAEIGEENAESEAQARGTEPS